MQLTLFDKELYAIQQNMHFLIKQRSIQVDEAMNVQNTLLFDKQLFAICQKHAVLDEPCSKPILKPYVYSLTAFLGYNP